MGIKNLNKILKKHCPEGLKEINIKELNGSYIAIDTSIYLYKYSFMGNMLESFVRQLHHLLKNNITPVYIFDGKPTEDKKELIKERKEKLVQKENEVIILKEKKESLQLAIDNMNQYDINNEAVLEKLQVLNLELCELDKKICKKEKSCIRIDWSKVNIFKQILDECNIFYYQCDGETDIYVKEFFKHGLIDYALTEDLDFLTHSCNKVLYNYNYTKTKLVLYDLEKILEELELTQPKFIDMCILMGCDYTSTIEKIGTITAYKLMKIHNNIEEIIEQISINKKYKKYKPKEDFNHIKARNMFNFNYEIQICRSELKINKKQSYVDLVNLLQNNCVKSKYIGELINSFGKMKKVNKKPKNIMMFIKKKK